MVRFLFLLSFIVCPVRAQSSFEDVAAIPDTSEGRLITILLGAVNSKDSLHIKSFIRAHFSPALLKQFTVDQFHQMFVRIRNRTGGLDFHSIRVFDPPMKGRIVVVRGRLTESWSALVLELEADAPHRILDLSMGPVAPPESTLTPLNELQAVRGLEAYVTRLAERDIFSGVVLLARDEKVLYQGAFGPASRRFNVPNSLDTRFNIGSMNKMFTAVAMAQLIAEGKLSYADSLDVWLDKSWLPNVERSKIKIRHLAGHTSGLGSYFTTLYKNSSRTLFRMPVDYKSLLADSILSFEPGTDWAYSNTGMLLLGLVIEKAGGKDYHKTIRERVYEPAGMKASGSFESDQPIPNLAIGYERSSSNPYGWINNHFHHAVKGGPAGGGYSTIGDLHRFALALMNNRLTPLKHTQMLTTAKPEGNASFYGYGFFVLEHRGMRIVGHGGDLTGISANLDMFPEQGYIAVVLANMTGASDPVENKIRNLVARITLDQ